VVAEGVVMDSGMWWGNLGWLHTSSASLKAWGLDPCVVAGLCRHFKMTEHVVGTCGGSSHGYGGRGYIPRWFGGFTPVCCTKPSASHCGHMTSLVFKSGVSSQRWAGVGVKLGAFGLVVGPWGVILCPTMNRVSLR